MKREEKKKRIKAVMTVEAALVLPLFVILFMNLLSIMEVYRIHSSIAASLWEEGRKTAEYLYLKNAAKETIEGLKDINTTQAEAFLASLSGRRKIGEDLAEYPVWESIVAGGKNGLLVTGKTDDDGVIRMDCSYVIHPLFPAFTPVSREIENHYYGHAWTGYVLGAGAEGDEREELYVFITETGSVYHKNRGCSYLNPSVQNVSVNALESLRNKGGGIYYACPLCDKKSMGGSCYITDYGTNYHTSITCSGLKRTIYQVKLSEVEGRGACSKCGG